MVICESQKKSSTSVENAAPPESSAQRKLAVSAPSSFKELCRQCPRRPAGFTEHLDLIFGCIHGILYKAALQTFPQDGLPEQQPRTDPHRQDADAPEADMDEMAKVRRERQHSRKVARDWLASSPQGWLYMVRVALNRRQHAMHKLIFTASPGGQLQRWHREAGEPFVRQHRGNMRAALTTPGFAQTLHTLLRFTHVEETGLERSETLRAIVRPQAVLKN